MVHEPRPHRVRPVDQLPSGSRVPPLRKPLRRGSQMAQLLRLGSVPIDGFRPADLPRKPPRYRSVPAFAFRQALPHGIPLPGARHWPTPTIARLEDLCRRPSLDSHRAALVRPRSDRHLDQTLRSGTTIDLCLSLFPWAKFRRHKAAVKMHTLLDLHGHPHVYPHSTAKRTTSTSSTNRPRGRHGSVLFQRRYSHPVDRSTGVRGSDRHPGRHRIGPSVSGPVAAGATSTPRRTSGCSS